MRLALLTISILLTGLVFAQEPVISLNVVTKDDNTGSKLADVSVVIKENDAEFVTKKSAENGKVPPIDLPLNRNFTMYIQKEGYVTKIATFDTHFEHIEDLPPFIPFPIQTSLFVEQDDQDFAWLESTPMIKFSLDQYGNQTWDQKYTKRQLKKIELSKKGIPSKILEEYLTKSEKSRDLYKQRKPDEALKLLDELTELWPEGDNSYFREECELFSKELEDPKKYYENYVADGDNFFDKEEYSAAKKFYQNANRVRPEEQYPKDQISNCELKMKEKAKEEIEAQYQKVLATADKYFEEKNYEKARALYVRCTNLKPSDPYPIERLEKIDVLTEKKK